MRLNNVPADTRLAFAVEASSRITVALLTETDSQRYPAVSEALFTAAVEPALTFSATVKTAGTYYLVLDNEKGNAVCQVRVAFRAMRGTSPPPAAPAKPEDPPGEAPSRLRQRPDTHEM